MLHTERRTHYKATVVGGLWMPTGAPACIGPFTIDAQAEIKRGALDANPTPDEVEDYVILHHSGDFSSVIGCEIEQVDTITRYRTATDDRIIETRTIRRSRLIKRFTPEAEDVYIEATSEPED